MLGLACSMTFIEHQCEVLVVLGLCDAVAVVKATLHCQGRQPGCAIR